ncbi:MAG: hypothetical protein Kow0032_28560 [Methyloligellaceae bacterium]
MSESVIADDLHIKGELTTNGDVELKGTVEGEITCRTLLVAEEAKIQGSAAAEKVVIRGTVDGSIAGNRVTLTSSAKVTGELICKALSIDEEAYFDGRSQRVDDPLKGTKRASGETVVPGAGAIQQATSQAQPQAAPASGQKGETKQQAAGQQAAAGGGGRS